MQRGSIRISVPRWALCLAAALGLAAGPSSGAGQPEQEQNDPHLFRQDFRAAPVHHRFLKSVPSETYFKPEPEGLRISLLRDAQRLQSAGVETRFRIKGDCDITVSYELLQVETPTEGFGAGISLRMTTDTPNMATVLFECLQRVGGLHYVCQKVTREGGQKAKRQMKFVPAQADRGKLRLVRQGGTVSFLVAADAGDEFTNLHELDLGAEDLVTVAISAESKRSDVPVTVRIHELEIRARDVLADALAQLESGEGARAGRRRGPLAAVLGAALIVLYSGVWLWRRRQRRAGTTPGPSHG